MVTEQHVLLVDIGNTRIKYLPLAKVPEAPLADEPEACEDIDSLLGYVKSSGITHLYLASVRDDSVSDAIGLWCQVNNVHFREVVTEKQAFGLTNSYDNVASMGVDRWLAMIASMQLSRKKAFCVIDTGTATTVDFVISGKHDGGWIVPGYQVMKTALVGATKRVFAADEIPSRLVAGRTTQDGVANGCLAAVEGVYLSAIGYLTSKQTPFDVILSGGDKKLFANVDQGGSIRSANLVVQGLARYAKSELFA